MKLASNNSIYRKHLLEEALQAETEENESQLDLVLEKSLISTLVSFLLMEVCLLFSGKSFQTNIIYKYSAFIFCSDSKKNMPQWEIGLCLHFSVISHKYFHLSLPALRLIHIRWSIFKMVNYPIFKNIICSR